MEKRDRIKPAETKSEKPKLEFSNLAEAEQYLDWKKNVPQEVRRLVESAILEKEIKPGQTGLPLSDQFLNALSESFRQKKCTARFETDPKINNLLEPLGRVETKGGYLNVFETMTNPVASWNLKKKLYETQIKIALEWLVDQDLNNLAEKTAQQSEEKKEQTPEQKNNEDQVPPQNEDVRSSMESGMEKREGEPQAQFRVNPFYGGYYKRLTFNSFGTQILKWGKPENIFREAETGPVDLLKSRIMSGKIAGGTPLSLPLPYDWAFEPEGLQTNAPEGSVKITRNQNGLWYLDIDAPGIFDYQIKAGPRNIREAEEKMPESETVGDLPEEISQKIEDLKKSSLPKMKQIRELAKFIRSNLTYSNSNDAWNRYAANPTEFFRSLWKGKEADCFVANTLAVRAISEIDKNTSFVSGYFVKEKNKDGEAVMHAGNGHAWMEIWDDMSGRAIRLDATPKGDPNLDSEQQERDLEGETGEGDFGESEEELASEEEVKKKIEEMQKSQEKQEKRKITHADLEQTRFSELAQCSEAQAREFLNALERVRQIKDNRGNSISDLLKEEWKKIIIERKIESIDYRGPVRMDEGDRLEDPVSARIDIRSGEFNPIGFEKHEVTEKTEMDFGGINIYFSFDLSGSMAWTDGASGRRKVDVQRDAALLETV